jgi:chitosanase
MSNAARRAVLLLLVTTIITSAARVAGAQEGGLTGLTDTQKRRAEQFTSIFENDTIELQYGYVENIHDGRGITAGRAGFTTGTGDLVLVVERYAEAVPGNLLEMYLPRLRKLAEEESDDTSGLKGLKKAWREAAKDPAFRAVQDDIVDSEYFLPAMARADALGLRLPLSRAVLYDTILQHGEGDDPDGLPALIRRTNRKAGGSPADGVDEERWLRRFLRVRRATLAHAHDPATREGWAEAVDRVDAFLDILEDGNVNLDGPIHVKTPQHEATIP